MHQPDDLQFREPWEARALATALGRQESGVITAGEWADALGTAIKRAQVAGDPDQGDTYYLHVLDALVLPPEAIAADDLTLLSDEFENPTSSGE